MVILADFPTLAIENGAGADAGVPLASKSRVQSL
jgi:hypothetical protein